MGKLYVMIAICAAASTIYVVLPGLLEYASHYIHWLAIVTSGHHIAGEFAQAIHPRERA